MNREGKCQGVRNKWHWMNREGQIPKHRFSRWGLSWVFTTCPQSTVKSHSITWAERESANHERRSGSQLNTQHSSSGLKQEAAPKSGRRWYLTQSASCTATAADVYDSLPSPTAVFRYAIRSTKLSANEQFFAGAQTAVILLQTTQIKQGVSFIAANKVYTSTNKITIVWIETELFFSFSFLTQSGCVCV